MLTLSSELQIGALSAMVYSDRGGIVAQLITPRSLDGQGSVVATRLQRYWQEHKSPPLLENLNIILNDLLVGTQRETFRAIVREIIACRYVNANVVIERIGKLDTLQGIRNAAMQVMQNIDRQGIDGVEKSLSVFRDVLQQRQISFDPGIRLTPDIVDTLLEERSELFKIGIRALDNEKVLPARKELFLIMGSSGRGKSWFLTHIGKANIMQRRRVLHISLEMSDRIMARSRYLASIFGISTDKVAYAVSRFKKDESGRTFEDFTADNIMPKYYFNDDESYKAVRAQMVKYENRFKKLLIKSFPSGTLTLNALDAYLDQLLELEKYVPDLIIIDYADLFYLPSDENLRHAISALFVGLRRIADERNCAVVTASQTNRAGVNVKRLDEKFVAESFNKVATSDTIISIDSNDVEQKRNLCRLLVVKSRNTRQGFQVLVSGNRGTGQFHLDSCLASDSYRAALQNDE